MAMFAAAQASSAGKADTDALGSD
ncbi:hypothetical protein PENARI_c015G01357 [Penicillium arizonense]|uniref:Uncharacterized protein n=1 Tax=Penicillium arizonense TaxID=1835702 RepID=A0A1F5LCR8_PENAI|nr:hypothetical protein PENARI_c015G01357 [Penicillium arizonense]